LSLHGASYDKRKRAAVKTRAGNATGPGFQASDQFIDGAAFKRKSVVLCGVQFLRHATASPWLWGLLDVKKCLRKQPW
jgi:hypothetical protein